MQSFLEESQDLSWVSVSQATALSRYEIKTMIDYLNMHGYVVLDYPVSADPRDPLCSLRHVFGSFISHSLAKDGIVTITPVEGSNYDGLTTEAQSLHTDGSFEPSPPPVVALQCEVMASNGGVSQLVQAEQVYLYLVTQEIPGWTHLFEPDAIEISTTGDNKRATHSVFRWQQHRLHMIFKSSAKRVRVTPKPEAELAYRAIQDYIADPANQIQFSLREGQILLMDNGRILHARTAFSTAEGKVRRMNRLWFDGCSPYTDQLDLGFLPNSTVPVVQSSYAFSQIA